ncbi:sensor histidine kinase [Saccharopolyspora taberi]|uniref:histidine kinase n=1 Tax=Saccharopolyspora taberi TaxID=60895 RepID=A0ABN3V370_9PSEU
MRRGLVWRPGGLERQDVRGLLHDLGHGLATLSYLAEGMDADVPLSGPARDRLHLMERELARLTELVEVRPGLPEVFEVRALVGDLVSVADLSAPARVRLLPGEEFTMRTDRTALWRMLANLVDNAARAAGPGGTVEVSVRRTESVTIAVTDDGPGFGRGPRGRTSLGLDIVGGLAGACGARLHIGTARGGGTRVELTFAPDG